MTIRVVLRPLASRDLEEAYTWYEAQQAGLGREFLDAVEIALARIEERPHGYPVVLQDARRALVSRFPYSIYYRMRGDEARILGVIHQSRAPRAWRSRARRG